MKTEKFKNGLSIIQLEERFEMVASGDRSRKTDPCLRIGGCDCESETYVG
jgi:hypothetical protein